MNTHIVVDVESDGPIIGAHSMVCLGAVVLSRELDNTFYGQTAPISDFYNPEALAISGFTRDEHLGFPEPTVSMILFRDWLNDIKKETRGNVILWSDNNGYDASWVNHYLLRYAGENPFGWSSRRIGDVFCGLTGDPYYRWKSRRDNKRFPHNHDPLSDALGNATALLWLNDNGFKLIK